MQKVNPMKHINKIRQGIGLFFERGNSNLSGVKIGQSDDKIHSINRYKLALGNEVNRNIQMKSYEKYSKFKIKSSLNGDKLSYRFSTYKPNPQRFPHTSRISTLLSQQKQHQHLIFLLKRFQDQSQKLKNQTYSTSFYHSKQENLLSQLGSLKQLSETINLFLLQLQIQQMSEIDMFQWNEQSDDKKVKFKQYRQNLFLEVQEKKLFYKRLENFVNQVVKEFQGLFVRAGVGNQGESKKELTNQQTQGSSLVEGDCFKRCFITENYAEIYVQSSESGQDYMTKSDKLKSFNILKLQTHQTNYALKLRFLVMILGRIKTIYQTYLLSNLNAEPQQPFFRALTPLNDFLSKTIISPSQYATMLQIYFNQFNQDHIKNYLSMSVGYYSTDIIELNKELVDVKIRETTFDYNIKKICQVYMLGPTEWLFNREYEYEQGKDPRRNPHKLQSSNEQYYSVYQNQFKTHKQYCIRFATLILEQINKQKKKLQQQQEIQLQDTISKKSTRKKRQKSYILLKTQYNLSLNKLLPYQFFTVNDIVQLQPLIQELILPLIVNPKQVFEDLIQEKRQNYSMEQTDQQYTLKDEQYLTGLSNLLSQLQENVRFLSRFLEWNIPATINLKEFIELYNKWEGMSIMSYFTSFTRQDSNWPYEPCIRTRRSVFHIPAFFRVFNLLYHIKNTLNPIYIEDYIESMVSIEKEFNSHIKGGFTHFNFNYFDQLQIFDKAIVSQLQNRFEDQSEAFCPHLMRFRILTVLTNMKTISYSAFFEILNNREKFKPEQTFKFLFYGDSLERILILLTEFKQKRQTIQISSKFRQASLNQQQAFLYLTKTQTKFNDFLKKVESLEQPENYFISNFSLQEKAKFMDLLNIYEQNDLLYFDSYSDQEKFTKWLGKLRYLQQKPNKTQNQKNLCVRENFDNTLNILKILSQNTDFTSSTMNYNYFNYIKSEIKKFASFEKFEYSWNYPFRADLAFRKKKLSEAQPERLYIKTFPSCGVKGRGKFFKQDTRLRRNFMGFVNPEEIDNFVNFNVREAYSGIKLQNHKIIQARISIERGIGTVNFVKNWYWDKMKYLETQKVYPNENQKKQNKNDP